MTKISHHHDADGIISAYFTKYHIPDANIVRPETFGDTTGWEKGDYMVDMRPRDPTVDGFVIDHHPDHPGLTERNYSLVWGYKPASLLCWEKFKDEIPKDEWWKAAIGAAGDGQPEKLSWEIYESCPELIQDYTTYMGKSYGKWKTSSFPIYKMLSSPVNAFMRYREYDTAWDIISQSKSPMELLENREVQIQKSKLKKDFQRIMQKHTTVIPMRNLKMQLAIYDSKNIRLSGYIASVLEGSTRTATMAVNSVNGSLSLRGDLANYIKYKVEQLDYVHVDGHDGFMGGNVDKDPWKMYRDLMKL